MLQTIKDRPLASSFWACGMIAGLIGYFWAASYIYFELNQWTNDTPWPWSILSYLSYTSGKHGIYLLVSFGVPLLLAAVFTALIVYDPKAKESRWATPADIRKMKLSNEHGLILGKHNGKFLIQKGDTHAFLVAPSRSGKGVGIIIPNLLAWPDTIICLDVKRENFDITSGYRHSLGHKVINFAPFHPERKSHCYNPLDFISKDPYDRITDLQTLATTLIKSGKKDPHFPDEARDLFVGLVLYIFDHDEYENTIGSVFRLLNTRQSLKEVMEYVLDTHPEFRPLAEESLQSLYHTPYSPLDPATRQLFNSYTQKADKERSGIQSTLGTALRLWRNPVIDSVTSKSDFSLYDLRKKRHAIYLGVGVDRVETLTPLMRVLFDQTQNILAHKLPDKKEEPRQVLMILDEFHLLGHMDSMIKSFTVLAGFNIRVLGIAQSLDSLETIYSKSEWRTFFGNCAHKVYYATDDSHLTAQYVSQACGQKKEHTKTINQPHGFTGYDRRISISTKYVPLIKEHEVDQLGDYQIVTYNKQKKTPIKCKKIKYYDEPIFSDRLLPPAPVPDLIIKRHDAPQFDTQTPEDQEIELSSLSSDASNPLENQQEQDYAQPYDYGIDEEEL